LLRVREELRHRLTVLDPQLLEDVAPLALAHLAFAHEGVVLRLQSVYEPLEAAGAEYLSQYGAPRAVVGDDLPELPLRQHDRLPELAGVAAKELGKGGGDGRDLVGDDVALTLGHVEEFGPVLLRGSPGTALLGTLLVGAASNEVTLAGVLELQLYQGAAELVEGRDGVPALTLVPARLAVQREAHGVQHGALARAGRAVDKEQAVCTEPLEIDHLLGRVRTIGSHDQADGPHAAASSWSSPTTSSRISSSRG